jgi:ATP-dependent Clp protease ATP-binding subunit ClpX
MPVVATVSPLDVEAMVSILTVPKNALIKQYQRMFELDGVELVFDDEAVVAVAEQALERGTGARGLRAILEEVLQDTMFEVPGRDDVARVVVTRDTVLSRVTPAFIARVRDAAAEAGAVAAGASGRAKPALKPEPEPDEGAA